MPRVLSGHRGVCYCSVSVSQRGLGSGVCDEDGFGTGLGGGVVGFGTGTDATCSVIGVGGVTASGFFSVCGDARGGV